MRDSGSRAEQVPESSPQCAAGRRPDTVVAPGGRYFASVSIAEAGMTHVAIVKRATGETVFAITDGILNWLWTSDGRRFLYAVPAVYGVPGIYSFDTELGTNRREVSPRTMSDSAYPDGADWFALCSVSRADEAGYAVRFLRVSHVDSVDEARLPGAVPIEVDTIRR